LIAGVKSPGKVVVRSTARLFGDVEARELVVESGAVIVGAIKVGEPAAPAVVSNVKRTAPFARKLGAA
jgi:cytoskeletal protein CcmA (bactofilin family)